MKTNLFANGKHPRYWTTEERIERFLAASAQALAGEPIDADDLTAWHEVDDPLTGHQRELISNVVPEGERYSPLIWLKLREPGTHRVVRCRGWYDHIRESWIAQESHAAKNSVCGPGDSFGLGTYELGGCTGASRVGAIVGGITT